MALNKKKLLSFIVLSVAGLSVALYFKYVSLTTEAVDAQWQIPARSDQRPVPVTLDNGSFESPDINTIASGSGVNWAYVRAQNHPEVISGTATEYVHGWNISPLYNVSGSGGTAHIIELQKPDTGRAPDGNQYVELNVDGRMYLSQSFQTTPGTRLYYDFDYKSRGSQTDSMGFVMKDPNISPENAQNILELNAGGSWVHYSGRYDVPQNQYVTEIGFRSLNDSAEGNLIDKVEVKTGAYLEAEKTSDRDSQRFVKRGESITYRLRIENFGQTAASRIRIRDRIDSNVEYVGAARVNGVSVPSTFDPQEGVVEIHLEGMSIGDVQSGNSVLEVSYQARAKAEENAAYSVLHSSQATVFYRDMGYEDLPENAEDFFAFSNLYQLPVIRELLTTEMGVSLSFERTNFTDMARTVRVGLYRNDVLIQEADLNAQNHYSYIFSNLEQEYLRETPTHAQGVATPSVASSSDAVLINDLGVYHYDIRILGGLDGFTVRRVEIGPNYTGFVARYMNTAREDSTDRSQGGSIPGAGQSRKPEKEKTSESGIRIETRLLDETKLGMEGETLRYEITVSNESFEDVRGIWIRDYFSEYCNFVQADANGRYGMIGNREFANWFIDTLAAKESRTLYLEVVQDHCLPQDIKNEVKYSITGSLTLPWTNDVNGP